MKRIISISFIILASSTYGQWIQTSGPSGGGVSDFAFLSNGTILAATFDIGNGVFASTDSGSSWHESGLQAIMLSHISANGMTAIASSTQNSFNETDTIYRSSDGGASWQKATIDMNPNGILGQIDAISSICYHNHEWFLSTEGGAGKMYRSDDDGLTWISFHPATFNFFSPVIILSANANLLVGESNGGQVAVYTSSDGTSYNNVTLGQSAIGAAEVYCGTVAGITIIFGIDGGVIYSQDGGTSWTQPVLPGLLGKSEHISQVAGSGNDIIAVSSQNKIFVTHDGGQIWNQISGSGLPVNASFFYSLGFSGYFYLGTSAGILRQSLTSTLWNYSTDGLRAASIAELAFNQGSLFASTERGVSYSSDQGNSWHDPQNLADLNDVSITGFSNGASAFYAYGAGIYLWNGANWNTIDTGQVTAFTEGTSARLIACRVSGDPITGTSGIDYSTNNGASWGNAITFTNSFDTEFYFLPHCMASNGNGTILIIQKALVFQSFSGVYTVYRSSDNGNSWTAASIVNSSAMLYYSGNEYYLGTFGHGIYHSIDDGLTWLQYSGIPDGADVTDILKIGNSLFISVTGNGYALDGMYYSSDDGASWHYANYGTANIFGPLAADATYIYSGGPSVWHRPLQGLSVPVKNIPAQNISLDCYPNPAGDFVHLYITSSLQVRGTVIIYDEKGIKVSKQDVDAAYTTGDLLISLAGFSEGAYFTEFRDRSDAIIASSRFIVKRK